MIQSDSPSKKNKDQVIGTIKYPLLTRHISDSLSQKNNRSQHSVSLSNPATDALNYLAMKQKFSSIYKRIQKYKNRDEDSPFVFDQKLSQKYQYNSLIDSKIYRVGSKFSPAICKIKTSNHLQKKESIAVNEPLQINTVSETQIHIQQKNTTPVSYAQVLQKSRYHKKLQPLKKSGMSNNIKDYLCVQKIALSQIGSPLLHKAKLFKDDNLNNLMFSSLVKPQKSFQSTQLNRSQSHSNSKPDHVYMRANLKFKPPFQLYYYRDFIWKIGFSNNLVVSLLQEYDCKIKFFVGAGNNSNLIKGIMKRRPWFQLTDKQQDAHFVWTQIKVAFIYPTQKKAELVDIISQQQLKQVYLKKKITNKKQKKTQSVFNQLQNQIWQNYWTNNIQKQRKTKQNLKSRNKTLKINEIQISTIKSDFRIHNHFCNSFLIGNKKALFKTMSQYYSAQNKQVFQYLPLTFHIKNGIQDDQYLKFLPHYYAIAKNNKTDPNSINKFNAWIVKPGQNTNRGNGIIVCLQLSQIKAILKTKQQHSDGSYKTYILQKYIEHPLLYKKRKFDLRHYIMINCSNGRMKGYWYRQGYVRTTSSEYTLKFSSGSIHLTNDAVQKNLPQYGKYQKGNKVTYEQLDAYIKTQDKNFDFWKIVYPRMKQVASDAIRASALNIDPTRRLNNFEIFGLDFMIDQNYSTWLIEINTNPCLETNCPVLSKIIPRFIENTFQICVDPLFPAPLNFSPKYMEYYKNLNQQNNFELVFDERIDRAHSIGESMLANSPDQQDDTFDDDGQNFGEDDA